MCSVNFSLRLLRLRHASTLATVLSSTTDYGANSGKIILLLTDGTVIAVHRYFRAASHMNAQARQD